MKRIIFAAGFVVMAFGVAVLAQTQTANAEQELIKLENGLADAEVKNDIAFLDRILADDYTQIGPNGKLSTKAEFIAGHKTRKSVVTSCVNYEIKVRVYSDAAVVTGRSEVKETYEGKDYAYNFRWTDTWIKAAGRWQCVAGQSSSIRQKKASG